MKRKAEPPEAGQSCSKMPTKTDEKPSETPIVNRTVVYPSATKCVGILPGLAAYSHDSGNSGEDDSSSDDSELISNNLLSSIVRNQEQ